MLTSDLYLNRVYSVYSLLCAITPQLTHCGYIFGLTAVFLPGREIHTPLRVRSQHAYGCDL